MWSSIKFRRIKDTYALTLQLLGQDIKKCGLRPISPHIRYLRPHSSISWTRYQEMWSTANFPAYKILTPSLFNFLDKISRNVVYCQFPHIQNTYTLTLQFLGQDIKECGLLRISPHTRNLRPHSSTSWTRYQEMWSTANFPTYKILTPSLFNFLNKISRNVVFNAISLHRRYLRPHSSTSWTRYQEMWSTAYFPTYKILTPSLFNFLDKISRNVVFCKFRRLQDTYTLTLQLLGQDIKKCGLLPFSLHTRYLRPHSSISWTRYQEMWSTANFPAYKILTPSPFNFLDKI